MASELRTIEATGPVTDAHVIAACRLYISLVRVGSLDVAHQIYNDTLQRAAKQSTAQPFARGWLAVAGAEFAFPFRNSFDHTGEVLHTTKGYVDVAVSRSRSL